MAERECCSKAVTLQEGIQIPGISTNQDDDKLSFIRVNCIYDRVIPSFLGVS